MGSSTMSNRARGAKSEMSKLLEMGDWKHGLLGCFTNPGICCLATFGYPFLAGKNAEAIGEDATFWAVVSWSPCVAALLRGQIRKKKGIDGKLWQDFCVTAVCPVVRLVRRRWS